MRFTAGGVQALVVGASRGIGLALARQLADSAEDACIVVAARHPQDSPGLSQLLDVRAKQIRPIRLDVTDERSVSAAAKEIADLVPALNLVVNCAGLLHDAPELFPERKLAQVEPHNLDRLFRVHAVGPLLLAKHLQPLLPRRGRVVFASLSARVGSISDNRLGGWYAYRMSKAAHNMAIKNLSIELSRRCTGIICMALHPGTVATSLSEPFVANVPAERLFDTDQAACRLLDVICSRTTRDNGKFFAWDGSEIPW